MITVDNNKKEYEPINIVSENGDSISSPSFDNHNEPINMTESGGQTFVSVDRLIPILEKL